VTQPRKLILDELQRRNCESLAGLEKDSRIAQNSFPVRDKDVMTGAINLIYSDLRNAPAKAIWLA
jgi:hypothetical protein